MFLAVSLSHAPRIVQVSSSPLFVTRLTIEPIPTLSVGVELKSNTSAPAMSRSSCPRRAERTSSCSRAILYSEFSRKSPSSRAASIASLLAGS